MRHHFAFKRAPSVGQFAKDGAWENAWTFDVHALPTLDQITTYTGHARELAFETFFGDVFFGVRCLGDSKKINEFAIGCVIALEATVSGKNFLTELEEALQVKLLISPISYAEIGAVNAWRSVGGYKLESLSIEHVAFEKLLLGLSSSKVALNKTHKKAIEFAFESPIQHWLGVPISEQTVSNEISSSLLKAALALAQNYVA
jgi:hypothetical protein